MQTPVQRPFFRSLPMGFDATQHDSPGYGAPRTRYIRCIYMYRYLCEFDLCADVGSPHMCPHWGTTSCPSLVSGLVPSPPGSEYHLGFQMCPHHAYSHQTILPCSWLLLATSRCPAHLSCHSAGRMISCSLGSVFARYTVDILHGMRLLQPSVKHVMLADTLLHSTEGVQSMVARPKCASILYAGR